MIRKLVIIGTFGILLLFSSSCAAPQASSGSSPDYTSTKKMVVDMLKSDEGKQALLDTLSTDAFKKELVINNNLVKQTIVETMTSNQGKAFWTSLVQDPSFSTKLAKAMESENKTLLQQLMKDPTYQNSMMDILKSPDMQKVYLDLMKTPPFRQQMQKTLVETMQNPLFATQLEDALKNVVKAEIQKTANQSQGGGSSSGGSSKGGASK